MIVVPLSRQNTRCLVNLGCGLHAPEGWINVDGSWSARLAKYPKLKRSLNKFRVLPTGSTNPLWSPNIRVANLERPLPFASASADVVYSSHTLEHLSVENAKGLIKEIYRILKSGGICRIVVPDGANAIRQGLIRELSEADYNTRISPISEDIKRKINGMFAEESESIRRIILTKFIDLHTHKYLYNEKSLCALLAWGGLKDGRRCFAFESRIPEIYDIELADRAGDGSLCVEASK